MSEPEFEPEPTAVSERVVPVPLSAVLPLSARLVELGGVSPAERINSAHLTGTALHLVVALGLHPTPAAAVRCGVSKHRCWCVASPGSLRVFNRYREAWRYLQSAPTPHYIVGLASLAEAFALVSGAGRVPANSVSYGDLGPDGAETRWNVQRFRRCAR